MIHVGLTGSIAGGKSTVGDLWRARGVPVVSADELARDAVAVGSAGLGAVVDAFGESVLAEDGSLDRAALRSRVFSDASERRRLEAILHPRIAALRERWVAARAREGADVIVSEIPLLFEVGLERDVDVTVAVVASEATSLDRLQELRGLSEDEARAMLDAQIPAGEKARRADVVIWNDGSLDELAERAGAVLDAVLDRAEEVAP